MSQNLLESIKSGERARFIPVVADTSKEGRATSVALAAMAAVPEFAKVMMSSIGYRVGKTSKISSFTEVVLKSDASKKDRPDGLVQVVTGKRVWSLLVEAKIGGAILDTDQVERYITLGKANKFDALVTISNQFAALPTHHPVKVSKNQIKNFGLYHWSWQFLVTQAMVLLVGDTPLDPSKRYILEEMVRYFRHPSAGIKSFERMNSEWKELVVGMRRGVSYSRKSIEVVNTVAAWHQEQRDLSLQLTQDLATPVSVVLSSRHQKDPERRLQDDCARFSDSGKLDITLRVPDLASDMTVVADITTRLVTCSMKLSAPEDKKTTKARLNWLLRQLRGLESEELFINGYWRYRAKPDQVSLKVAREAPEEFDIPDSKASVSVFEICLIRDLAGKFSGSRTFVEEIEKLVPEYYLNVAEQLRAWIPPPPKIRELPSVENTGNETAVSQHSVSAVEAKKVDRTLAWLKPFSS